MVTDHVGLTKSTLSFLVKNFEIQGRREFNKKITGYNQSICILLKITLSWLVSAVLSHSRTPKGRFTLSTFAYNCRMQLSLMNVVSF